MWECKKTPHIDSHLKVIVRHRRANSQNDQSMAKGGTERPQNWRQDDPHKLSHQVLAAHHGQRGREPPDTSLRTVLLTSLVGGSRKQEGHRSGTSVQIQVLNSWPVWGTKNSRSQQITWKVFPRHTHQDCSQHLREVGMHDQHWTDMFSKFRADAQ